jgi:hypothetical protein
MDLERSWRRKIAQATGAGIAAPAAIVAAALAVGVGGGGLRSIGSLSQALTGPQVPGAERDRPSGSTAPPADLLARANRTPRGARATATPATSGSGAAATTRRTATRRTRTPSTRTPATRRPATGTKPAPTATAPPAPQTTPAPAPTPTPTPSALRQVGDQVKQVTDQVPVVGPPAGQAIDTIVDTADQILPKR